MINIIGIGYKNYAHYTLYWSCLPIYGIAIGRSLSFLYLDDFERNANFYVAIKSGSTVCDSLDTPRGSWQVSQIMACVAISSCTIINENSSENSSTILGIQCIRSGSSSCWQCVNASVP